jgi:hypothetical protein
MRFDNCTPVDVNKVKKGDRVHGSAGWVVVTKVTKDNGTTILDTDAAMPDAFRILTRKPGASIFRQDVPVEVTSATETAQDDATGAQERFMEAVQEKAAEATDAPKDETPKKAPARKRTTKKETTA